MERNSGIPLIEMYYNTESLAQVFLIMRDMYNFDGILLNTWMPRDWKKRYDSIKIRDTTEGNEYILPDGRVLMEINKTLREVNANTQHKAWDAGIHPSIEDIEPKDVSYHLDYSGEMSLQERIVAEGVRHGFSVHGEVGSPVDGLCILLGLENAMIAFLLEPDRCKPLLEGYVSQNFAFAKAQIDVGVDTMKISSPFVGGSFISRECYEEFVVPYEGELVRQIKQYCPTMPIYTHTCGFIGDRLELMQSTGIDGIECMDPPPLGDTELSDAKKRVGDKLFLKGNMDSVNVLLHATPDILDEYVKQMIADGGSGGGYILSSACSVAPEVDPEIMKLLVPLAEKYGTY
jgi:uroporphyrinogen-III decarboxylase